MDKLLSTVFPELTVFDGYFTSSFAVLHVASTSFGNRCPECGHWTNRVHSHYHRTVEDIPICGMKVVLRIHTRKFVCTNPHCYRRIFSERFPGFLESSQRKTVRLNHFITQIAFSLGGNPGAAFCERIGLSASKDTLLRRVQDKSETPDDEDVSVIGIDDWAYKRGQRYGTIIVDLQHHRLVDLLPDRSVSSVANWLRKHPGIRIVSRDRAGIYADGIRQGLPSAMQIADRWHILKNLGDAVERFVSRQRLPSREHVEDPPHVEYASDRMSLREQEKFKRRQTKWELAQHVQQLHSNGLGIRAIAREVGLSRKTIREYMSWSEVPVTHRKPKVTLLDPYRQYVVELVQQSLSGPVILERIRKKGYTGSRSTLSQYVADLRRLQKRGAEPIIRRHHVSPRTVAKLLAQSREHIKADDIPYLNKLLNEMDGAITINELVQSFHRLMKTRNGLGLDDWLERAMESDIRELQNFARGIRKDYDAVFAGISEPWSNGQVEGQVNRLKNLKRQMYGRASFVLLRARVLHRVV